VRRALRGALVGFGFIAEKGHLPAYRTRSGSARDVEIVAVSDVSEGRRRLAKQLLPGVSVYADYRTMLAETELDFVDICIPPGHHAAVAHAALDRGLHVLCEKPLATSVETARAMLDHAAMAKRVLFPCHNYKHAPVIKQVRRIIESGRIGRVGMVTLNTLRNTHALGVAEWRPDWRREHSLSGGGIAMDHGSHSFYLAFEWLSSYPTSVTAKMHTLGPWDTEDNFSCSLVFPTGLASAHLSWTAGMRKVLYTISGDRGGIVVDDDSVEVSVAARDASGATRWEGERMAVASQWMDASHASWFGTLFEDFLGAIDRGEWVGRDAWEAFLCVQLITTAYQSSARGSRELPLAGSDRRAAGDERPAALAAGMVPGSP
jgi:predicted dehydrogenase